MLVIDHTKGLCLVRCDECGSTSAAESSGHPGGARLNAELDGYEQLTEGNTLRDYCRACLDENAPVVSKPTHTCRSCKVSPASEPFGRCRWCDPSWLGRALARREPPWLPFVLVVRHDLAQPVGPRPEWARFDDQLQLEVSCPT